MATRRFFYVTQDSLVVWKAAGGRLREEISFSSTDEGYRAFSTYLQESAEERSIMLVDVIEEEFDTDSIPKLSGSDRKSLIDRRLGKRFARTAYRIGMYQGRNRRESDQFNLVLAAITNHELIDPWVDIIAAQKSALVAITSVPLMAADVLRVLREPAENAVFVTQHQGGRLRLVFIKSGQPISARLSGVLPTDRKEFNASLISEIMRSRKYLERSRSLGAKDQLDVYLIAQDDTAGQAFVDDGHAEFRAHFIDPDEASACFGQSGNLRSEYMELLYLAFLTRKPPQNKYALRDRTDYSRLLRVRHTLIGLAAIGAVACSVVSGVLMTGGLLFRNTSQTVQTQITRLEETYRREHEEFEPIRADSHEMKLVVDSGDFILRNSLPVEWVMGQIGIVMGDHSDMHVDQLRWEIDATPDANPASASRRGNEKSMPVPIPEIATITASLSGEIRPYDGNLHHAFEKIDELASNLQRKTSFDSVAVARYPIDARTGVAVSGEVLRTGERQMANFNLSLTLRIDDETD